MKTSYEEGYARGKRDVYEERLCCPEKSIDRIVRELQLDAAYRLPSFYCYNQQTYRVIITRYHRGYIDALTEAQMREKEKTDAK
jgi:hypothetical protein